MGVLSVYYNSLNNCFRVGLACWDLPRGQRISWFGSGNEIRYSWLQGCLEELLEAKVINKDLTKHWSLSLSGGGEDLFGSCPSKPMATPLICAGMPWLCWQPEMVRRIQCQQHSGARESEAASLLSCPWIILVPLHEAAGQMYKFLAPREPLLRSSFLSLWISRMFCSWSNGGQKLLSVSGGFWLCLQCVQHWDLNSENKLWEHVQSLIWARTAMCLVVLKS